MLEVLQQLQFTVRSFGQDGSTEWLHNLLDCHILSRKLILGGAAGIESVYLGLSNPYAIISYQTRPNAPIPTGCRSEYLQEQKISIHPFAK